MSGETFYHRYVYPVHVVAGMALGGCAVGLAWYVSDIDTERRRKLFKRLKKSLPAANLTLFGLAFYAQTKESKEQTIKNFLLIGGFLNFSIIFVYLYNKRKRQNISKVRQDVSTKLQANTKVLKSKKGIITNPLILLIGISKYDTKRCKQFQMDKRLDGVEIDIENLQTLFKNVYNYTHIKTIQDYIDGDPQFRKNCDKWAATDKIVQAFCKCFSTRETIMKLSGTPIDSLIVCYSGHGCENDWLFCSNGELLSLYEIKNYFNEEKCPLLKDKPKLFYIDCCRQPIFSKFTTKQNDYIKNRGCGAQDTAVLIVKKKLIMIVEICILFMQPQICKLPKNIKNMVES